MHKPQTPNDKGIEPPEALRKGVLRLVEEDGEKVAAERLRISRHTLARLAAGFSCQRATIEMTASKLGIALGDL